MRIGILVALLAFSMGCSDTDSSVIDGGDGGVDDAGMLGSLGESCSSQEACETGFCVDGVCCDAACDDACATCGGDGICRAAAEASECRASAGACDVAETCDGASLACPPDLVVTSEMVCRSSVGTCDIEELCDGTSAVCPNDEPAPVGTPCGNYVCSGSSVACPTSCTSHEDCASGTACVDNVCMGAKWAFVTASSFFGGLGGLAGADNLCQASADSVGLGGTYRAWLADSTGSPSTRFARSNVPYVMPAGPQALVLANDYADLTDGTLARNFSQNESGGTVTSGVTYTNVFPNGTLISQLQSCMGWTSSDVTDSGGQGTVSSTTFTWTNNGGASCNSARRLFCFEQ